MTGPEAETGAGTGEDGAHGRTLRPLVGVLAAMAVSLTGTRISAVALPWFVLVTTGSVAQTGLVAFCELAPYVTVKAGLGPLVDRVGPRVVSWSTDLVSAVAAAAVPVLHVLGVLAFWQVLALVAVIGAARGPGDLAKEVMVPEAAERARVPLERAAGVSGVTERLAGTVGPAVGGGVVALLGAVPSLGVIAVLFALGSLVIGVTLPRGVGRAATPPATPGQEGPEGYWRSFVDGFRFLRGDRLLLLAVGMICVTNLLDMGVRAVLLPAWAQATGGGPEAIGLVGAALGGAAICGSLVATVVAHRLPRRMMLFLCFLVAGAPRCLAMAAELPLGAVVAVVVVGGFAAGFLNPILAAVLFERVPRHLLGRVGALGDSVAWAGMPFGGLLAGAAVAGFGLAPALVGVAVVYVAVVSASALRPEWREMDRTRSTALRHSAPDNRHDAVPAKQPDPPG
ncbi:MFS transporter [Streptomyces sp. DSM 42041]|uniref:Multidrug efflux pump Tap n=1 Tax=Streptomyces hazeniae TaxID=3075538 RepID=A0ABU2NRU4_9ACTN|nr:MFS transporter [Streptomyces sp. DSM 42041]MDT0379704.1 MFS transporter [Streptomyces sp. DSM 42041]